jgi:hypothetical protein
VILVAACSAPAPGPTTTPLTNTVATPFATSTATPAPYVQLGERAFEAIGLPAVAAGGEVVVVPSIDPDGGRGNPNLTILVRDMSDAVVQTIVVMNPTEFEDATLLEPRIAAATTALRELHARYRLVPMQPMSSLPDRLRGVETRFPAPVRTCAGCTPCENPAALSGAYQAPGIAVTVVRITYTGTDMCWEPGDQLRVVR